MINSICVVRLSALGDVLMAVPLIRTLQSHFPNAKLTWIISRPAFDLVEGMEGIEFVVIEKPKNLLDYWRFKKRMQAQVFDVLLAPQASLRANLLYRCIRATRKIGYDKARANDGHSWFVSEQIEPGFEHTVDGFLKFAKVLGVLEPVIRWDLPIQAEDYAWVEPHVPSTRPLLVVNPAASKLERSWAVENYVHVLQKAMHEWQVQIVITGGPGALDKELAQQIKTAIPSAINLAGQTKPKQLLALISKASAVLCPDTGPSHMANAVNTPVVALHAVTNPLISGPYCFQSLVVNRYPEAAKKFLGANHIESVWGQHVHSPDSMKLIGVQEVLEKLAQIFKA